MRKGGLFDVSGGDFRGRLGKLGWDRSRELLNMLVRYRLRTLSLWDCVEVSRLARRYVLTCITEYVNRARGLWVSNE